jgi:hypothetical protein
LAADYLGQSGEQLGYVDGPAEVCASACLLGSLGVASDCSGTDHDRGNLRKGGVTS